MIEIQLRYSFDALFADQTLVDRRAKLHFSHMMIHIVPVLIWTLNLLIHTYVKICSIIIRDVHEELLV